MENCRAHYEGIGPEIWQQTSDNLHAFVATTGTSGTLAGVSCFLQVIFPFHFFIKSFFYTSIFRGKSLYLFHVQQEKSPSIKCFLIYPLGYVLFNKVTRGVMYTRE